MTERRFTHVKLETGRTFGVEVLAETPTHFEVVGGMEGFEATRWRACVPRSAQVGAMVDGAVMRACLLLPPE